MVEDAVAVDSLPLDGQVVPEDASVDSPSSASAPSLVSDADQPAPADVPEAPPLLVPTTIAAMSSMPHLSVSLVSCPLWASALPVTWYTSGRPVAPVPCSCLLPLYLTRGRLVHNSACVAHVLGSLRFCPFDAAYIVVRSSRRF